MKELVSLFVHLLATLVTLVGPGGVKAVVAQNLLLKHQLLIIKRSRKRSPNLFAYQRLFLGVWSSFLNPRRLLRSAVILKPSTMLRFHNALKARKYRWLYSSSRRRKPGPKGPSAELVRAIVELKKPQSPLWLSSGCAAIKQYLCGSDRQRSGPTSAGGALPPRNRPW
jgi:putative transposase